MIERVGHPSGGESLEAELCRDLARGDAMAETLLPILRHLIAAEDSSVFSDEILARVRGMLAELARSLLEAAEGPGEHAGAEPLVRAFIDNPALLSHVHAQALEWQLAQRLQVRLALDPVVSPLLQALIASPDAAAQALAMTYLAAQARWCQAQRRMTLTWRELPGDLLHGALLSLRTLAGEGGEAAERIARTERAIRSSYDEATGRLALAARLVAALDGAGHAALSLDHAGVSLFLTALAWRSGQPREAAVLSTHEAQSARLALALRSAGLEPVNIRAHMMTLHGDVTLPAGFDRLDPEAAGRLLGPHPVAGAFTR